MQPAKPKKLAIIAAFFALGIAKQNRRPTLLIATSGSAAAHWHPAVIEAYEAGIPLLLLSADRPPEFRDWGFNQTTDQQRLFLPIERLDPDQVAELLQRLDR